MVARKSTRVRYALAVLAKLRADAPATLQKLAAARRRAAVQLAQEQSIAVETVQDKLWRGLGLKSIEDFDRLAYSSLAGNSSELRTLMERRCGRGESEVDRKQIAEFFGTSAPSPVSCETNFWWVNQGSTYDKEHQGSYLWAPERERPLPNGTAREHRGRKNMIALREGDFVLHAAGGQIRAVSRVSGPAEIGQADPAEDSDYSPAQGGVHVHTSPYHELQPPVRIREIPDEWRLSEKDVFRKDLRPHQSGYVFKLSTGFVKDLMDRFEVNWPAELRSALTQEGSSETPPDRSDSKPGDGEHVANQVPLIMSIDRLTVELVREQADEESFIIETRLIAHVVAALRAGKHLLLIGPPGTGKTTLAEIVAEAATQAELTRGWTTVTATADWTSAETVGAYWMTQNQQLVFRYGQILRSLQEEKWLIIDELNRADIDKAFGQFFTVLSGQAVTLPFLTSEATGNLPISIVPTSVAPPDGTYPCKIPPTWRLIATLNTRDRDLLFGMSFALLRRFAVIELPNPAKKAYRALLAVRGATGSEKLDDALKSLIDLPHRPLGPAILLDCAGYMKERRMMEDPPNENDGDIFRDSLGAFVVPQLDGLNRRQLKDIVAHISKGAGDLATGSEVAEVFNRWLGVPVDELEPTDLESA